MKRYRRPSNGLSVFDECPALVELAKDFLFRQCSWIRSKYIATLPFYIRPPPYCNKASEPNWHEIRLIIRQTEKRWCWFSDTHDLNVRNGTNMGTLAYLPREIGNSIYALIFDVHFGWKHPRKGDHVCTASLGCKGPISVRSEHYHMGEPEDVFRSSGYDPLDTNSTGGYIYIRLTSSTLRIEFDKWFLSNTIFLFNGPETLRQFLSLLTTHQQLLLRRIVLQIRTARYCPHDVNPWLRWMGILQANLTGIQNITTVTIDTGIVAIDPSLRSKHCLAPDGQRWYKEGDIWHGARKSLRFAGSGGSFKDTMKVLDVLSKQLKRCAPRVSLELSKESGFSQEEIFLLQGVLHEVE